MTILVKLIALDDESEQRTTTGRQINANERINMEPSSQLLLLLTPNLAELQSIGKPDRQAGQDPVYYGISNSKHISKVPMSSRRLRSHSKTKNELSGYLAEKFLDHAMKTNLRVFVAWGSQFRATHQNANHLQSDQEEADTKMLLPALDATANGETDLYIHSPDTDVLVLPLRRYPGLCVKTSFVAGTGDNHRVIGLSPVATTLGSVKHAALPAFHAFNGTDITRRFSGKGKISC